MKEFCIGAFKLGLIMTTFALIGHYFLQAPHWGAMSFGIIMGAIYDTRIAIVRIKHERA